MEPFNGHKVCLPLDRFGPAPALFDQRVIGVCPIRQEHIGKGAPILVVTVGLEGDFLPKGEGRALSPNPVKLWGATWASN